MTFMKVGLSVAVEYRSGKCVSTSSGVWCLPLVLHVHSLLAVNVLNASYSIFQIFIVFSLKFMSVF